MSENIAPLVSTDWLANHLDNGNLRVFDCTVFLTPQAGGGLNIESGRGHYDKGHVPSAGFLDLIEDLSDSQSPLRFTMPPPESLARVLGAAGIGDNSHVVLYCAGPPMWATRVWWMLRAIGFDSASVLDGGLNKWKAEGRPLSTDSCQYSSAALTPSPRPSLFASKQDVAAAIGDGDTCIMNTLSPKMYRGEVSIAPRPGRITDSINLPALDLTRPDEHTFLPLNALQKKVGNSGSADRIITYCGGGIAATQTAFALHVLGHENVAVYDGSMSEWASDPDAPMETG
jgi:thiosulfate/3-mercaptopyruvate sulfurtransferase